MYSRVSIARLRPGRAKTTHGMSAEAASKTRVCIIGAGAAGLYASHLLRAGELGDRVEVLHFEADAVIGGRVRAHVDPAFSDFAVEMGAEEVHGEKSLMYRLANACPTVQIVDHGKLVDDFYWMNGKLLDEKEAYKDKELKKVENFEEWLWKYKGAFRCEALRSVRTA